ncbi:serine/threonine-protein kinase [Kitasatospora sp. NPDC048538]|uniref:serine/threonine-protein kinase n=1 Tax=unclassified Kitasatospora TaxID=2633591 RepID=UPI0033DBDC26
MHDDASQDTARDTTGWELPGYRHQRELGAGAGGRVVLALHEATGTPVAIKYLHDGLGGPALRREAEMLARVDSPHVTRLYEYVEGGPSPALVMELVDGLSLRTLLKELGATTPQAALTVLKGSLLGLAAAHEAGLVHRDYKPANVLVDRQGASKLVDFGIAVPGGDDRDVSGTPAYLAPEQWEGAPAAPAADVYAATVTFFECLVGHRPFTAEGIGAIGEQHRFAPVPEELVPEPVRPLIRAGLAKRPADRPAGAAEFVRRLDAVATAGYGERWEERGHEDLAALVALLAALLPWPGPSPAAAGTTALARTVLTAGTGTATATAVRRPVRRRASRRPARLGIGAVTGALVLASIAGIALAGVTDRNERTVAGDPMPLATTTLSAAGGTTGEPSGRAAPPTVAADHGTASPSPSPTAPHSPSPFTSPSHGSSGSNGGTGGGNGGNGGTGGTGGGNGGTGGNTGRPTSGPPHPPTTPPTTPPHPPTVPTPPTTPPTTPPSTPPTTPPTSKPPTTSPPPVRVTSLNIDSIACDGGYGVQANVTVVTSGPPGATLEINWMHNSAPRDPASTVVASDTVKLAVGRSTVTVRHQFGTGDNWLQWGLQVATAPFSERASTTYRELYSPGCHEPG